LPRQAELSARRVFEDQRDALARSDAHAEYAVPNFAQAQLGRGVRGYVCGSSGFADAASDVLVAVGVPMNRIRVERFGPTG
jgi:ferredoxin-NADP reductase